MPAGLFSSPQQNSTSPSPFYSSDPVLEALQDILRDDAISTMTSSDSNKHEASKPKRAVTRIQQSRAFQVVDKLKSTATAEAMELKCSAGTRVPSLTSLIRSQHAVPQSAAGVVFTEKQSRSRPRPRRQHSNSSIAGMMNSATIPTACNTFTQPFDTISEREQAQHIHDSVENSVSTTCDYVVPLAIPAESPCIKKKASFNHKKSSPDAPSTRWGRNISKIDHRLSSLDQFLERALEEDILECADDMPLDSLD
eukprot:CAMPEP_0181061318 /NCGR_PEP_ID=MMETSP1070-20121207/22456_1 /TAXON_ID=265543 /ORGANISM="Minutocellus polymorphus, Strain NH13" /LENGTH=252 /DNA_ID=CAMNT_0023141263 /DNA_START=122 /DNA_END=880 /DNA_ORIENTATION=+